MPERKWYDIATMPHPLDRAVWAEKPNGQVQMLGKGLDWWGTYRRWTPVLLDPKPTPPPYEEPLPAIAPCRECMAEGKLSSGGTYVRCPTRQCWEGPARNTPREAIESWNAAMRKPEEPKPVEGRTALLLDVGTESQRCQLYTDGSWRPVE